MRVRPHCLIISLLLVITLVAWHSISSITGSRSARDWDLINKQDSQQDGTSKDGAGEDRDNSGSSLRFFQTNLYQKLMGRGRKEENSKGAATGKGRSGQKTVGGRKTTLVTHSHRMDRGRAVGGGTGHADLIGKTRTKPLTRLDIKNIPDFGVARFKGQRPPVPMDSTPNHDKWIVVTTIAQPTEDVKFLANISGWRVVVVGDTKTPSNWSYPNCIYLSVSKQMDLGLSTPELLPTKHYARKNVGYLYAIAHGAEVVYETDDDNRPLDKLMSFELGRTTSGLMYSSNTTTFNPYKHFGQPTLWPRGFPLSQIGLDNKDVYKLSDHWSTPAIQQGVVNGDPDMDAIFRLTRKLTLKPLDVRFDPAAPPVLLPPGVFSPFNSQNTLFMKSALWALLIPTTTTFRMCDIWRGYWAQRLLWEIGAYIGFYPPNAYQQRNAHNYMADMLDEKDMYFDTDKLLKFLTKWTCPDKLTFFQCVYKLTFEMAVKGFWQEADVTITQHWLEDLVRIGYKEPKRLNYTSIRDRFKAVEKKTSAKIQQEKIQEMTQSKSDVQRTRVLLTLQGTEARFVASEQISPEISQSPTVNTSKISRQTDMIAKLCPNLPNIILPTHSIQAPSPNPFKDMLLIVVFNWPFYTNARFSEAIYRHLFPNILYCGENATQFAMETASYSEQGLSFVEAPRIQAGQFSPWCVVKAMQMNYNVNGYFVTGDDVMLNVWNFRPFETWRVWMTVERYVFNMQDPSASHWMWWNTPLGNNAYNAAMKSLAIVARLEEANNPDKPVNIDDPTKAGVVTNDANPNPQPTAGKTEDKTNNVGKASTENSASKGDHDRKKLKDIPNNGLYPDNITYRPSEFIDRLVKNIQGRNNAIHAISDIYFIPARLKHDAIFYFTHFLAHNVFVELSVATVLYGLENPMEMQAFHGTNLWMEQRTNPWSKYNTSDFFLHPVKLSVPEHIGPLCTAYLPTLLAHSHP